MGQQPAALVTGASSGIGLAIARGLAEEGHAVTMTARRAGKLASAADDLAAEGHEVLAVPARIGEPGAEQLLVKAHQERFGRLDVLVNNVGIGTAESVELMPDRKIDLQLGVNLRSVIAFYKASIPLLRVAAAERGGALVVNTSSVSARSPKPTLAVYAATKAAVVTFTHAMNKEIGTDGIKSCALCPGYVATPMTDHIEEVPMEDMIRPSDIAEMVRALLRLSPTCVVPEISFQRPGGHDW